MKNLLKMSDLSPAELTHIYYHHKFPFASHSVVNLMSASMTQFIKNLKSKLV